MGQLFVPSFFCIAHAPLEPRAAGVERQGNYLNCLAATQQPFRVKDGLGNAIFDAVGIRCRVLPMIPDLT